MTHILAVSKEYKKIFALINFTHLRPNKAIQADQSL